MNTNWNDKSDYNDIFFELNVTFFSTASKISKIYLLYEFYLSPYMNTTLTSNEVKKKIVYKQTIKINLTGEYINFFFPYIK